MTTTDYTRPASLSELLLALAEPDAVLLAGGTDLVPRLKAGHVTPRYVVSMRDIDELRGVDISPQGITIGAGTRLQDLIDHPELAAAYPAIGQCLAMVAAPQHRRVATIGGNLCLDVRCDHFNQSDLWREAAGRCRKSCGSLCHIAPNADRCYAVLASDGAGLFSALGARITLQRSGGSRTIDLTELYRDDGVSHLGLASGELVTAIHLPSPPLGHRADYQKLRRRAAVDFPLLGVSTSAVLEGGVPRDLCIVLTAVQSSPCVLRDELSDWSGRQLDDAAIASIADLCFRAAHPMRNTFGNVGWRRRMVRVLVSRSLHALRV